MELNLAETELLDIQRAADAIRSAEALIITAGAGMAVDAGLPDYRGKEGFWNCYPPYRRLGLDYEAMTRPRGFQRDPGLGWGFYGHLQHMYRSANPHAGYQILRRWGERMPQGFFVLTTNVDGLFLKAGIPSDAIHECHGSVHRLQCIYPCRREVWSADGIHVPVDPDTMRAEPPYPTCRYCGSLARPAVFAFGDTAHVWEFGDAQAQTFHQWQAQRLGCRVVIVECGSGPTVPGLRREGEALSKRFAHGSLVRINPAHPEVTDASHIGLRMGAAKALVALEALLGKS